jgi:uncharacterized Tic20 family protein
MGESSVAIPDSTGPANSGLPAVQRQGWRTFARHKLMSHVDRRIAAVSHFSIAFGVLVGVGFTLGIAINLVIWLRSKRSPFIERHAEQAGAYQLAVLLSNLTILSIWIGVVVMLMGDSEVGAGQLSIRQILMGLWCALLPLHVAWFFGTILYGVYAGLVVAAGGDFSYPIFGPWAQRRAEARSKASHR